MTSRLNPFLIAAAVGIPAAAVAAPHVDTMLVRDGYDAGETRRDEDGRDRPRRAVYPGGEQAQLAQLASGEILMFGMGSYRLNGELPNHRNQMFCASIKMDPVLGPQLQNLKYVTNNRGDRYRNAHHPRVTPIFNGEAVAVTYNYAPNNHAYAYQLVFGPNCEQLSERTRIVAKNNDNCSETGQHPEIVTYQDATTTRLFSAHGCNGNGSDDSWAAITEIRKNPDGTYTVEKITDDIRTEREEERSRPDVLATNIPDLAVVCLTAGNTQPPNRGVYCSGYDTQTGEQLWRMAVAKKEDGIYRTQIRATPILDAAGNPTNKAYVTWQELTKRRRKEKGTAKMMASVISYDRNGMSIEAVPQTDIFPGGDATHASQCSTLWGEDGAAESRMVLISGSINGNASALSTAHVVGWNDLERKLTHVRKIGLAAAIDTGWLSNLYGENPTTQGRNYIQCIGNVRNPGYGVTGGYQPDVRSFVAIAAHTRRIDPTTGAPEEKLATELVLIPAVTAPAATLPPDEPNNDPDPEPEPEPNPEPQPDPDPAPTPTADMAGCSTTGTTSGAATALLVALALGLPRRRRR